MPTIASKNTITIYIQNTLFAGFYPMLVVIPSIISEIYYLKGFDVLVQIPDQSVDLDFAAYFMAKDRFHNIISMND